MHIAHYTLYMHIVCKHSSVQMLRRLDLNREPKGLRFEFQLKLSWMVGLGPQVAGLKELSYCLPL